MRTNVRFRYRSGGSDGDGLGAALDRGAWEGEADTRRRPDGEVHPQVRAGEDGCVLVEYLAEDVSGAKVICSSRSVTWISPAVANSSCSRVRPSWSTRA